MTKPTSRSFRFTEQDIENLEQLGQLLVKHKKVFGLTKPSGGINMTAVMRYLMQQELETLQTMEKQSNRD